MNSSGHLVSVIIATLCNRGRAEVLRRAIRSVQMQESARFELIVVVNGQSYDRELLAEIKQMPGIRVDQLEEANTRFARARGRELAKGDSFCFLDDDDELLPGSLRARVAVLVARPEIDYVVSNGLQHEDRPAFRCQLSQYEEDPLGCLLAGNWLGSSSGLFRANCMNAEEIAALPKHTEWSTAAYRLTKSGKKAAFLDYLGFKLHRMDQSMQSASLGVLEKNLDFHRMVLADHPSGRIRRRVRAKIAQALHSLAAQHLKRGELRQAMSYHVDCLLTFPYGCRFLTFGRKLIGPYLRSFLSPASSGKRGCEGTD